LKLEVEFLKYWLIDHGEEYYTVLDYISKRKKDLWVYSAKIFKYIDHKLHLMSIVQSEIDEISSLDELKVLREYFSKPNDDQTNKIQRIMINRIHSYFLDSVRTKDSDECDGKMTKTDDCISKKYLQKYYDDFEKYIHMNKYDISLSTMVLIAWFKAYLQIL